MNIVSEFRGLSFDLSSLYQELSNNGWSVKKLKYDSGSDKFVATGQASHGEEVDGWGPDEKQAMSNLLLHAIHRNGLRQTRVAKWKTNFTEKMSEIAEEYSKAPVYDPKAAIAFMELGRDAEKRAETLGGHLDIQVTNNPEPYPHAEKMCEDIRKRRKLEVSAAGIDHPIWSKEQALAFRIAFDVLGYCASGGDWGWEGTNQAFAAYAHLIPVEAQKALFTHVIAQSAYVSYYRAYGPQKIALFPKFMDVAQEKENPHDGYAGVHPSQSYAPLPTPRIEPLAAYGRDESIPDPQLPQKFAQDGSGIDPTLQDPNAGWQSGIEPMAINAYMHHGDPIQAQSVAQTAKLIDTEWAYMNENDPGDLAKMKQAIVNAFRVVILSPRKDLRWNAIHYQDIAGIPGDESDPTKYWNVLEQARQNWNVKRFGEDARYSHMPYFKKWKKIEQLMYQANPEAGQPAAVKRAADFINRLRTRVEEKVAQEDADKPEEQRMPGFAVENKAKTIITNILTAYINEHQKGMDVDESGIMRAATALEQTQENQQHPDMSRYGAFMGNHLKAIAQVSQHVDELLKASLYDVHEKNGEGYHFRSVVLQLQIPQVGPKVASFAWLLLQPMTSQLGVIDTHMMDVLGHNFERDMNPRDYFKFERELQAGRDAAGYGHMPLGQFQWGMWDLKRTGQGSHQDHSAMKVLDPLPHDQVDWKAKEQPINAGQAVAFKENWQTNPPDWWAATLPARQAVAQDFDQTVAPNVSSMKKIPWNAGAPVDSYNDPLQMAARTAASALTPFIMHPVTGQRVIGQPGQTIAQHAAAQGLTLQQLWQLSDEQVGKA